MTATIEQDRYTTVLPDLDDSEAVYLWLDELQAHTDIFGVKKLIYSIGQYREHLRLMRSHLSQVHKSLAVVNGIRTSVQRKADKDRSLQATARRFYESLTTNGLRMQCQLFQVDYDSYESQEDIIAALVEKHMAMEGGAA